MKLLFDFEQVLESFKPAKGRICGYYCLRVLAGAPEAGVEGRRAADVQ